MSTADDIAEVRRAITASREHLGLGPNDVGFHVPAEALSALDRLSARIEEMKEERDRIKRNRDMWRSQCERQAEQLARMRGDYSR